MNEIIPQQRVAPWSGAFFSARYFLMRALALGALFAMAQLVGLREYTSFISGTTVSPEIGIRQSAFMGMIYLVLYMGCVVLAPILVLAAGLLTIWERRRGKANISSAEIKVMS